MKKTTTVPVTLIIAVAFGYIAFADHDTFTSLFAVFLSMASFAVALGLIWEKEEKILRETYTEEEWYGSAVDFAKEPTFAEKIKSEEKRIDTVNNYDDFLVHGIPEMNKNLEEVRKSLEKRIRKVRSDKGVKRK